MEDPSEEGEELPEIVRNTGSSRHDAAEEVPGRDLILDEGPIVKVGRVVEALLGVDAQEPFDAVAERVVSGDGAHGGYLVMSHACWARRCLVVEALTT